MVVGLPLRGVRTPYGQSGSFRGLELIPSKCRCPVPPRWVEPVETTSGQRTPLARLKPITGLAPTLEG